MVGGTIIGLSRCVKSQKIHVHVADCPHWPKHDPIEDCPYPDTCCVYTDAVKEDGTKVVLKIGDKVWWQQGRLYWTPQSNHAAMNSRLPGTYSQGVDFDIELRKIGYSH